MQESTPSDNRHLELRIPGELIDSDSFEAFAENLHAMGTSEETDVDADSITRIAWFPLADDLQQQRASIVSGALLLGIKAEHILLTMLDDDWATAWQKHWTGLPVGQRLWVRPSFCDKPSDDRIDIVLDPGQAFGTGTHATTRLCLESIENYCTRQTPQSVLDMGSGSGLLAIAAGKLGAHGIVAVDYDPLSVEASTVNAKINHVSLTAILGDTPPQNTFELLIANILAEPLIQMAEALAATVSQQLILSGLLQTQVDSIIQAYQAQGLTHLQTRICEEWAAVEFVR